MEIKPTELVFVETSTQTYSLSGEGFGYNYGRLRSSASHGCRKMTVLKKWENGESWINLLNGRDGRHCVDSVCAVHA